MALLTFSGNTQNLTAAGAKYAFNDSTCLPNAQLRAALKLIEQGKQCERELQISERSIEILQGRLILKDSIIGVMADRISIAQNIRETYERDVELYRIENSALAGTIASLRKDLKKQKRKTVMARIGIVAVGALATYIIRK